MGLQLVDEFIQVTDTDASTKVLLTNSSGITQHVEMGTEIGVALHDVIDPPPHPAQVLIPESTDLPTLDPDEVLSGDNCSRTGVRVVTSTGQRKKRLRELLRKEFDDMSIPAVEKNMLWSLLEEYHNVFSLEGERGETDLVELEIDTGDAVRKRQPSRRVPFAVRQEIARQLRKMQEGNVI